MLTLPVLFLAITTQTGIPSRIPSDARFLDLDDGYVRVSTDLYSVEVPKGWTVSQQSDAGQRKISNETGTLTVMTAGNQPLSWDELYRTSISYIQMERAGKATPYETMKAGRGYEAISFSMQDEDNFADRRYVLLKSEGGEVVALSVEIGDRRATRNLERHFKRFVKSAKIHKK